LSLLYASPVRSSCARCSGDAPRSGASPRLGCGKSPSSPSWAVRVVGLVVGWRPIGGAHITCPTSALPNKRFCTEETMSGPWVRCPAGYVSKTVVTLLVFSVVNVGVPAFAGQITSTAPLASSTAAAMKPVPAISFVDERLSQTQLAFERSVASGVGHLALAGQDSQTGTSSGHWCATGLGLLAGGVAAAVVAGVRRNTNPQKPNPPVGVVLGTGAAAVGGIQVIRACRR
jgi:hypothetical protein